MAFLLLIDGMTWAGKSTCTKIISKSIARVAVVGMDRVKRFIVDFERWERDNAIARDVVFAITKTYLANSISVIVEHPFKTNEEVQQYEDLAKQYEIPIYKFQLYTTPEVAFQRVTSRQQDSEDKVPEDRILKNIGLFQKRDDFVCIDTTSLSSGEVAQTILSAITN